MPLPLAHPAAVLPLRRFCPRYFAFSALVVGSLAPDFAYVADYLCSFSGTVAWVFGARMKDHEWVVQRWDWDDLSHTFAGGTFFSLPAGLLVLWVFRTLRASLVTMLPNPHRAALEPFCGRPERLGWVDAGSLLVGAWIHIVWDSFTNSDHWLARTWPLLRWPVLQFHGQQLLLYRALWLISSFAGPVLLGIAYLQFLKRSRLPLWDPAEQERRYYTFWVSLGLLSVVIALPLAVHFKDEGASVYNFTHQWVGLAIAVFCGGVLAIGVMSKYLGIRPFLPETEKCR